MEEIHEEYDAVKIERYIIEILINDMNNILSNIEKDVIKEHKKEIEL